MVTEFEVCHKMNKILKNEDGKALGVIFGIVGAILVIPIIAVVLTVTGSYKNPPSAINWAVVGSFIAEHGTILEVVDDTEPNWRPRTARGPR